MTTPPPQVQSEIFKLPQQPVPMRCLTPAIPPTGTHNIPVSQGLVQQQAQQEQQTPQNPLAPAVSPHIPPTLKTATLKMMRPTRLTAIQTPYTPKGYQPDPQLVVPPSPRNMFGLTELSAVKSGVNRFILKFAAHSIQEQMFQAQKLDLLVKELKVVAQTDQDRNRVAVMQTHTAIIMETMKLLLDQTSK